MAYSKKSVNLQGQTERIARASTRIKDGNIKKLLQRFVDKGDKLETFDAMLLRGIYMRDFTLDDSILGLIETFGTSSGNQHSNSSPSCVSDDD